ncbi:MAG: lipid-A-disaccharide synthase [Verrucomicrobiota bacterium]|nr:lipid-A-disaccharide synthase [Verrucomicrobiota bacterium]
MSQRLIMVIAGEVSGDMHAAQLARALGQRDPSLRFFGVGGPELRAAGMETLYDIKDMAVMGFVEVARRLFFFRRVFRDLLRLARARRPEAVILVDYPGFNLRFAKEARALGMKVIYYVCPQIWAWRRSRIPKMARVVDRLIAIFPFEAEHFRDTGLRVDFAGHPLVDESRAARAAPKPELPWSGAPRVALLPGSRLHVIGHVLPVMWAAALRVEREHEGAAFILAAPTARVEEFLRERIRALPAGPLRWAVVTGNTRQVLRQADAAMVASGTATIEASLMECPMIIVYRMPWLNYLLARRLVSVDSIGMVNIVAGRRVCPEFIQAAATPDALAGALSSLLADTPERRAMIEGLCRANAALGPGGAAERAADLALATLNAKSRS